MVMVRGAMIPKLYPYLKRMREAFIDFHAQVARKLKSKLPSKPPEEKNCDR